MKTLPVLSLLLVVLFLFTLPAAAALLPPLHAGTGGKPDTVIEYGTGKDFGLVKMTHIDYAKPAERPRPSKSANCYKLSGYGWAGPVTYTVAASPGSPVALAVRDAAAAWDAATSRQLFTGIAYGAGTFGARDEVNSVTFGDYADDDVIAITSTWFYPSTKTAVESDILFDTGYSWGTADATHTGVMDLQNIATHETGHTLGLSDVYSWPCGNVTMYGYSEYGDTGKRDLEAADLAGLRRIYGA